MEGKYSSIENLKELKAYQLSRELSKIVWDIVNEWGYFAKKTIGGQWIESTDSISANIAEGYGRFFFYDSIKFYYYSRGSIFESNDWWEKAQERNLVTEEQNKQIKEIIDQLPKELNILIKRTKINAKEYNNDKKIKSINQ